MQQRSRQLHGFHKFDKDSSHQGIRVLCKQLCSVASVKPLNDRVSVFLLSFGFSYLDCKQRKQCWLNRLTGRA